MRVKRNLLAAAVGAGLVWFNHPTEGPRRRRHALAALRQGQDAVRPDGSATQSTGPATTPSAERGAAPTPATLIEVVEAARSTGFPTEFGATDESQVRCGECGNASDPETFVRSWVHRLEGASDPDDMLTVSALVCPTCGAKGVLVLPFGPSADATEADVSRRLSHPEHADMAPLDHRRAAV